MIVRKPYAFLIKYFKVIHILMFIAFSYLLFRLRNVYIFFKDYVKTGHFTYIENMAKDYINLEMVIIVSIIFIVSIFIYLLMRKKEKPILFYKVLIAYSFALLVMFIVYFTFFKSLENTVYENITIVIYRDIIGFLYYINYFYIGFSFARGFGFDIKKFSFDKDKKELKITETDNEEYELSLNIDRENIVKALRKEKREFGYYIKDNKKILLIIGFLFTIALGYFIYSSVIVKNITYDQFTSITSDNFVFNIQDGYITNCNKHDLKVLEKDYFVVIKFKVNNNILNSERTLNGQSIRLLINEEYYYPTITYQEIFSDLGTTYNSQVLKYNDSMTYILIFKINGVDYQEKAYLELFDYQRKDNLVYKKVSINLIENNKRENEYKLKEEITIFDSNYQDTKFMIKSYDISDKFTYKYQECINEVCQEYVKIVTPNINRKVLKLELDSDINNELNKLFEDYLGISFNNKFYPSDNVKVLNYNDNFIYLSVPSELDNLILTTRTRVYKILVKE